MDPILHYTRRSQMEVTMKLESVKKTLESEKGRVGYILLWALGVPIPLLLLIYFIRGCR